jgi:hypothetical protein
MAESLVVTTCLGCGQRDDHPKHQIVINAEHESVHWHMDCHSRVDPACELCAAQTATAEDKIGAELREHLLHPTTHEWLANNHPTLFPYHVATYCPEKFPELVQAHHPELYVAPIDTAKKA